MMNIPTVKTLDTVMQGKGKELRLLLTRKRGTRGYRSVKSLISQCHNPPCYTDRLMTALNEIVEGHGLETIYKDGEPTFEYINMGDTYSTTIMRNIQTGRVFVACWGDIVERGNYN